MKHMLSPQNRMFLKRVKRRLLASAGIMVLLSNHPAEAIEENESVPNTVQLSDTVLMEQQAVQLALKTSRKLESLNTNVDIADYRFRSNGWISNPELRISDVSTRYYTDEFNELRLGLRWRLPDLGELGEEKQEARVTFWDKKVDAIRYRQQFIAKIRKEYVSALMYDQLADLARQRVEKEDERIRIVEQLVSLGNRSVVYYTKAKMWHAESRNDLARALQKQRLVRRSLARHTDMSESMLLVEENLPEMTSDLDSLILQAIQYRPEIELVQQRIELANRQKRRESLKLIPWLNFIDISYHREKKREKDWGEFMAGIRLPLFNWNQGNIKATDLAVKKKENELDAIRESIENEVRSAFIHYRDLLLDWKNFKQNTEDLISDTEKVVSQAALHETLMPDEVLEMKLTIIDTRKILAEKRRNLAEALIDLDYIIGTEKQEMD